MNVSEISRHVNYWKCVALQTRVTKEISNAHEVMPCFNGILELPF